eukprot:6166914-Alexandrium_andersonii.AAC.1
MKYDQCEGDSYAYFKAEQMSNSSEAVENKFVENEFEAKESGAKHYGRFNEAEVGDTKAEAD